MIFLVANGCIWLLCMMAILLPLLFIVMVRVSFTKELPDCGKLKFNNVGASLAVGAFQFSTTPSLTSGAGAQTWAKNFPGQLDQFRLYDKVLTATEIQSIYSGKE